MVNEGIYGSKGNWNQLDNTNLYYASFGNDTTINTIREAYLNNKISHETNLDESIVHSGLGAFSNYSKIRWVHGNTSGQLVDVGTDENSVTSWCFAFGRSNHAYNRYDYEYDEVFPTFVSNIPHFDSSKEYNVTPIVDFDYKTIRAVLKIFASDSAISFNNTIYADLADYLTTYKTSHPYIHKIYVELYDKGSSIGNQTGILIFNNQSIYKGIWKNSNHEYWDSMQDLLIHGTMLNSSYSPAVSQIVLNGFSCTNFSSGDYIHYVDRKYITPVLGDCDVKFNGRYMYASIPYYDGLQEFARKQIACFGIQFVESTADLDIDLDTATDEEANRVFIGVLDSNFVGNGNYIKGKAIKNSAQYKLDSANNSPFDPSKETDPNTYHNTSIKPINVDGNTSFTTKYVLNYGQLNSIAEDFYKALNTKPEELSYSDYSNSLFLTNNAIDTVVSCKYFPFQLPMTGGENVKMGNYTIKVNNEPLVAPITSRKVSVYEFECGSCFGEFGDFRDFEPYTSYELKVPFCGSVRLNASECVGKDITVSLAVDIESGSCTAFVYAGNELVESVSGSCGVDIPISAVQQATLDSQIFNASINQRQAKTNAVLSVAKGAINVGAGAYALSKAKTPRQIGTSSSYLARGITDSIQDISNSMYNAERANYNISHVEIPYKCVGAVSSGVCLSESLLCSLIKETPIMLEDYNPDVYAKTIGFACCKSGKIGSESGMVVCSDVRIENCTLTKTEKDMIIQLCKTGIIV